MTRLRLTHLEDRAVPATAIWDGGGTDANWMTDANWVGDVEPLPGDDIVFPSGPTQKIATNNFPAGTSFNSLAVNEAGYSLGGNALSVTAGVVATIAAAGGSTTAQINLPVGGTGGLIMSGGTLILSAPNTYQGVTTVNSGTLTIVNPAALGATGAGNETGVAVGASLVIGANNLNIGESIGFAGGGVGDRPGITVMTSLNATFSGPLTLTADGLLRIEAGSVVNVTAGIGESGGSRNLRVDNFGGRLVLAPGSTSGVTGTTTVRGTLVTNGTGPNGPVVSSTAGAILAGTGSVGALQLATLTDILAPGAFSPSNSGTVGTLTTAGLAIPGAIFVADITGAGSDRVIVNGAVQLGRTLQPVFGAGFAPTAGQRFLLIDNDGADPINGTFLGVAEGAVVATFGTISLRATYVGGSGNDFELVAESAASRRFAVGAGTGGGPQVNVYDGNGNLVRAFNAYDPSFRGGVNVATGDVNGDNVPDVVTGPGFGGGPVVRVWDGQTGALIREFLAYDGSFRGGVNVATGFIDTDNLADIITGAGRTGGPHVKGFASASGFNNTVSFFPYDPSFTGGVSVAGGEPTRPGVQGTIITGAGPTGGSHVRVFNAVTGAANGPGFFAFPNFFGGVNVAYNPVGGTIIVAPKAGGGPIVRGFNPSGALQFEFLAYDGAFRGGVSVGVRPLGAGGESQILTGPASNGGPFVRQWNANGTVMVRQFNAFDPAFQGGIYVG